MKDYKLKDVLGQWGACVKASDDVRQPGSLDIPFQPSLFFGRLPSPYC